MGNHSTTYYGDYGRVYRSANPSSTTSDDPLAPVKDHCKLLSEKDKALLKYAVQQIAEKSIENAEMVYIHYADFDRVEISLKSSEAVGKRVHIGFNGKNEPSVVSERVGKKEEVDKLNVESFQKLSEDIVSSSCLD